MFLVGKYKKMYHPLLGTYTFCYKHVYYVPNRKYSKIVYILSVINTIIIYFAKTNSLVNYIASPLFDNWMAGIAINSAACSIGM